LEAATVHIQLSCNRTLQVGSLPASSSACETV
jgi:hypothetical protein